MKRIILFFYVFGFFLSIQLSISAQPRISLSKIDSVIKIYEMKYAKGLAELKDTNLFPRSFSNNVLRLRPSRDWTSGFFPGTLWYIYEYTSGSFWKEQAQNWTKKLETEQFNTRTHDVGFMIYCSYGNGYRLTTDSSYKKVILTAARSLSSRYSYSTGLIRSWRNNDGFHPVIIDNMMNLELLFWSGQNGGDEVYRDIAVSHSDRTMNNHFRDDYSTWHVVEYDPDNGEVERKITHQGLNDSSVWARGQSWAIYGFSMCYNYTHDPKYLYQAKKSADFFLDNLPPDTIPYWDFNLSEGDDKAKESSAAAIAASGLLDIYISDKSENSQKYLRDAENIILRLMDDQFLSDNYEKDHLFVLKHSQGSVPHMDDYDAGINYADYYFLEALIRYHNIFYSS